MENKEGDVALAQRHHIRFNAVYFASTTCNIIPASIPAIEMRGYLSYSIGVYTTRSAGANIQVHFGKSNIHSSNTGE